jgi:hypothetical protein
MSGKTTDFATRYMNVTTAALLLVQRGFPAALAGPIRPTTRISRDFNGGAPRGGGRMGRGRGVEGFYGPRSIGAGRGSDFGGGSASEGGGSMGGRFGRDRPYAALEAGAPGGRGGSGRGGGGGRWGGPSRGASGGGGAASAVYQGSRGFSGQSPAYRQRATPPYSGFQPAGTAGWQQEQQQQQISSDMRPPGAGEHQPGYEAQVCGDAQL